MNSGLKKAFAIILSIVFASSVFATPATNLGKTIKGKQVTLEEFKGKVVLVSFWTTWCTYCLKEIPVLEKILGVAGTENMAVVAINWKEDRKIFRKLARGFSKSDLILTHDPKGYVALPYNVQAIPFLMIYDHDGRMRHKHHGYGEKTLDKIIDEINDLLLEQAHARKQNVIDDVALDADES